MRLLTAGAALAAALLTGGVPAVALLAEDPPATEEIAEGEETQREKSEGPPAHAARGGPARTGKPPHSGHGKPPHAGNPHGSHHGERMQELAAEHASAMKTWGPCMDRFEASRGDDEPTRAQREQACGVKPEPPGHLKRGGDRS